jgi:hypothetical protein
MRRDDEEEEETTGLVCGRGGRARRKSGGDHVVGIGVSDGGKKKKKRRWTNHAVQSHGVVTNSLARSDPAERASRPQQYVRTSNARYIGTATRCTLASSVSSRRKPAKAAAASPSGSLASTRRKRSHDGGPPRAPLPGRGSRIRRPPAPGLSPSAAPYAPPVCCRCPRLWTRAPRRTWPAGAKPPIIHHHLDRFGFAFQFAPPCRRTIPSGLAPTHLFRFDLECCSAILYSLQLDRVVVYQRRHEYSLSLSRRRKKGV